MKKKILSLILVSTLCTFTVAEGVAKTVSSEAQWQATANKDSSSELVVVATGGALQFDYAAAQKAFNTQLGAFSVEIDNGVSTAKDFTLSATVNEAENILTRSTADGDKSTLTVGTRWNNKDLKTDPTTLLDVTDYDDTNDLSKLVNPASDEDGHKDGRINTLSNFTFYIKKATKPLDKPSDDGKTVEDVDFSALGDGKWSGNVTVKFTANWKS